MGHLVYFFNHKKKKKVKYWVFFVLHGPRRTGTTHLGALLGFTAHQDYISPLQHGALMQCKLRGPSLAQLTTPSPWNVILQMAGHESWRINTLGSINSAQPSPVRCSLCGATVGNNKLGWEEKKCIFLTQKGLCCHSFKLQKWVIKLQNTVICLLFHRARECNLDASNSLCPNGSQVF